MLHLENYIDFSKTIILIAWQLPFVMVMPLQKSGDFGHFEIEILLIK